jgi:hypothetical protein
MIPCEALMLNGTLKMTKMLLSKKEKPVHFAEKESGNAYLLSVSRLRTEIPPAQTCELTRR